MPSIPPEVAAQYGLSVNTDGGFSAVDACVTSRRSYYALHCWTPANNNMEYDDDDHDKLLAHHLNEWDGTAESPILPGEVVLWLNKTDLATAEGGGGGGTTTFGLRRHCPKPTTHRLLGVPPTDYVKNGISLFSNN
jgi:hypothetical protein